MPQLLIVCTANLCRSPLAEHMFRSLFTQMGFDCDLGSAGMNAQNGEEMHPLTTEVLAERDITAAQWSTRAVSGQLVESSNLILTATRAHLEQILTAKPGAVRRTFVLGQFTHYLGHAPESEPATSLMELVQHAQRGRAEIRGEHAGDAYDLKDPMHGGIASFEACAATIDGYLERIAEHITVSDGAPGRRRRDARRSR